MKKISSAASILKAYKKAGFRLLHPDDMFDYRNQKPSKLDEYEEDLMGMLEEWKMESRETRALKIEKYLGIKISGR